MPSREPGRVALGWRRLLRLPSRSRPQLAAAVDDELAFHLEMREAELRALGLAPADAAREARRRFGDVEGTRVELRARGRRAARAAHRRDWGSAIRQDLALALRRARREPVTTAVVVATLALGTGASVAMASVAHRMLIAPLPFEGVDRLVVIRQQTKDGSLHVSATLAMVDAMRGASPSLERVEGVNSQHLLEVRDGVPHGVDAGLVTPGLLDYLHVVPALGRAFGPDEVRPGGPPVLMLSWSTWQRRFEGSPSVLGRSLTLDGRSYAIVGVMPRLFDLSVFGLTPRSDVWMPQRDTTAQVFLSAIGVLRRGATLAQVERDAAAAQSRLPDGRRLASLVPQATRLLDSAAGETRATLLVMAAAVALVLLIGCMNVANLLLARGAAREREFAVRAAIGASRGRLVRQLLVESGLLALLGGGAGLLVARGMLALVAQVRPPSYAALEDVRLDGTMLLVALGLSLFTALVFGLVPAWLSSRARDGALHGTRSVGHGRAGPRVRRALVLAEVACSVALVTTAVLLLRSAAVLQELRLGYDVDPVATLRLQRAPGAPNDGAATPIAARLATALERVRAMPGVASVALSDNAPGQLGGCMCEFLPDGAPVPATPMQHFMVMSPVDEHVLRTVGTRVLAGPGFSGDTAAHEAMVTAITARRWWPGASAIGQRFRLSREERPYTVVGVVEDQRTHDGWIPADSIHVLPYLAPGTEEPLVEVRVAATGAPTLERLSQAIESGVPGYRVAEAAWLRAMVREARAPRRFTMVLLAAFAAAALLLTAIGLYGVLAYGVEQRTREIGVRMALGATRATIGRLVVGEGLAVTAAGAVLGLGGSVLLVRLVKEMLVGVTVRDATAHALTLAVVGGAALAAVCVPAWRATRVDPMEAVAAD